ncbi:hypothetical protein ACJIZ3_011065 [Penstemon smallii]|uniref:Zinc finger PHD-type domain-containing protein n=1 Tax=Penstemon smallii TaxID=265156 RepID=A0ABD3UMB3_9LAMI
MESSDEEGEIVSYCVTNYYFVDSKEGPISFSILPLQWDNDQELELNEGVFLRGMVDGGCQQIYKKVIAWKFELSFALPELYVLSDAKYKTWIKLQRPRKSYEDVVRTVLISVHCLHFMKKNLEEESRDALWKYLRKSFSTFYVPPSEKDLVDHVQWINEAAVRDKDLSKAKNMLTFLSELSGKRKGFYEENRAEKKLKFIIDDEDLSKCNDGQNNDSDDNEYQLFDRVCAFCDDGGDILGCEGRCIRSFHPTIESGAGSCCESLGYSNKEVEAIQTFLCKNCQYQRHQCFICGRLGSSDKSSGAEVFPCVSATCGHFYHPKCVSELIFPGDDIQAHGLQKQIEGGDTFTCPAHKCSVCKKGEDKRYKEMRLAICRRCPKAYHRKCLPRCISFERNDDKNVPQRAWDFLLVDRVLIYCMDHKICRKILTPRRDHLLFPDDGKKVQQPTGCPPNKINLVLEKRSKAYGILTKTDEAGKPKNVDISHRGKPNNLSTIKIKLRLKNDQSVSKLSTGRVLDETAISSDSARPLITAEMENRIQRLIKDSTASLNMEDFLDQQRKKCTHAYSSNFRVDKTITMGMVERSVKAMKAALKKLQEGGSIEDAKAVCEPGVLTQMFKWKNKLSVYLAPFQHGMRYSSFGRHFTKVDKLKQVVDRLCWYAQDGDTVVDFCCGSNDFSCLMKEKLDSIGRKCSFKNYDLIQPKNDFNFEKRDWMSVCLEELPEGSNLIMGLNPPFGFQASLANKFIDKALMFHPKLLILIVPKETERLDKKWIPYDLIWEDDLILSGKSFYLPGSIDVNDQKIEQWNVDPPPLYLWSHRDWTKTHEAVALKHGHLMKNVAENPPNPVSNYLMEENQDCYNDFSNIADGYGDINCILEDLSDASDDI